MTHLYYQAIANFGSGASSVAQAEHIALQYYWYFMVITAFSSTMIANMVLEGFNQGLSFGSEFKKVVAQISSSLVQLSVTWFNWIIFRFTVTLPLNYLLQLNSFLFTFLGWKCCARMMRGGGPGAPVPYRLYVDSGVVLMCILALAPATPLLSLAGLAYFNIVEPLLRRNLIFVYRPKFDNGGARWDVIFEMIIVAICVGIVLLTSQMVLKAAIGPAVVTAVRIWAVLYLV
jgi:Calcium-dependent channel, 7TM region, putative phosphate